MESHTTLLESKQSTHYMQLFPYQELDARWLSQQKRGALFNDIGTGKTFTALAAARLNNIRYLTVVCPKVMIGTWEIELNSWGFKDALVLNYDKLIRKDFSFDKQTQLIICDESHALKSWGAQRTKRFFLELAVDIPYVWFLTATPLTKSAADLHPILSFCRPGKFGSFGAWQNKYCHLKVLTIKGRTIRNYYGAQRIDELNGFLKEIGVRRTKAEVLPYLPKMLHQNIVVKADKSIVSKCLEISLSVIEEGLSVGSIPAHIGSLIRAIGLSKVNPAVEFILQFEGTPVVVFFIHTQVGLDLQEKLLAEGKRGGLIYGAVSSTDRQEIIDAFQAGELDVILLQIHSAGVVITLTRG